MAFRYGKFTNRNGEYVSCEELAPYKIMKRLTSLKNGTPEFVSDYIFRTLQEAKVIGVDYEANAHQSGNWTVQGVRAFAIVEWKTANGSMRRVHVKERTPNFTCVKVFDIINDWCDHHLNENFGANKAVKTCNVKKEFLERGRISKRSSEHSPDTVSFKEWMRDELDFAMNYNGQLDHSPFFEIEKSENERLMQEAKCALEGPNVEKNRERYLARLAVDEIKKVMIKYNGVSEEVIREAMAEATIQAVIDL